MKIVTVKQIFPHPTYTLSPLTYSYIYSYVYRTVEQKMNVIKLEKKDCFCNDSNSIEIVPMKFLLNNRIIHCNQGRGQKMRWAELKGSVEQPKAARSWLIRFAALNYTPK